MKITKNKLRINFCTSNCLTSTVLLVLILPAVGRQNEYQKKLGNKQAHHVTHEPLVHQRRVRNGALYKFTGLLYLLT